MARPRGNYAVTAARRASIIQAALEIFGQSGYSGSSLRQVAEVVGMTEAGILHHFGSKGNLLIEVLQTRDDKSSEFIPPDIVDPLAFVTGWLRLVEYNVSQPGIVELYTKLSAEATAVDHPAHKHFMDRYKYVSGFNVGYFDLLRQHGMLSSSVSSRVLSVSLIAISDGLQIQWLLDPEVNIFEELSNFFESVLTPEAWLQVNQALNLSERETLDSYLVQLA